MSLTQKYDSKHEFLIGLEGVIQAYESERAEEARRKELSRERWREFCSFFSWKSMPSFRISSGGTAIYDSHKIRVSAVVAGAIGVAALGGIGAYNLVQNQKNFSYIPNQFNNPSIQVKQEQLKENYVKKDAAVPAVKQSEEKKGDEKYSSPVSQELYVEKPTKRQRPARGSNNDYGSYSRISESERSAGNNKYTPKDDSAPELKYNPNIANEVTTKVSEANASGSEGGDLEGALYDPSTKGRTRDYEDYKKGGKG